MFSARNASPNATHWWEFALCALLGVLLVFTGIVPGWKKLQTDFPNYYLAARLRVEGIPLDRAYEWEWFQRQKDHRQIDQPLVAFFHPPLCALPFLPLAYLSPITAKRIWISLNLLFLVLSIALLSKTTRLPPVLATLLLLLCFLPLRVCLQLGQYYVFLLLLLCVAFALYKKGFSLSAGLVVGFAAALKIFPALLVLVFLKQQNWRAVWGCLIGGVLSTAAAILVFGWEAHRVFFLEVLPRSLSGDMIDPYSASWSSWSGLWHRCFLYEPTLNPHPLFDSPLLYAILKAALPVAFLFLFWSTATNWTEEERDWQWATVVTLSLLISSIPSSYHYVVLALPVCIAVSQVMTSRSRQSITVALLGYILLSVVVPHSLIAFRGIARLVGTLLIFIALTGLGERPRIRRNQVLLAAGLVIVLAALNFWNLRGRGDMLARRLPFDMHSLRSASPAVSSNTIAFSAMQTDSYDLGVVAGPGFHTVKASGDVLSVAATPAFPDICFEATGASSTIQWLYSGPPQTITLGESPSVSRDGKLLAYIRENKGRGSLWIHDLTSTNDSNYADRQLTTNEYDVLDISFMSGQKLAVSARRAAAAPAIFIADINRGDMRQFLVPGRVRYPAISPDGKLMSFSRFEATSWHLYVRSIATGTEKKLTLGNCNETMAAWQSGNTLIYASDCGRGLGLTALARIKVE